MPVGLVLESFSAMCANVSEYLEPFRLLVQPVPVVLDALVQVVQAVVALELGLVRHVHLVANTNIESNGKHIT